MSKVFFFTEYSSVIGYGHLSRCTSLADQFAKNNFQIEFNISECDLEPNINYKYRIIDWSKSLDVEIEDVKNSFFIFDTYRVPKHRLNSLTENIEYPISISDSQKNFAEKGLVIFPSAYGNELISSKENLPFEYLAGPEYVIFRSGFTEMSYTTKTIKQDVSRILISLGGFIAYDPIIKIVNLVREVYKNAEIVVVGKMSQTDKLKKKTNVIFKDFVDVNSYINLLSSADITIINGGQSLNEALLLKIPSIVIPTAKNQCNNIKYWLERKACLVSTPLNTLNFSTSFKNSLEQISDIEQRSKLINTETNINGLGAKKIIEYITARSIPLDQAKNGAK